MLGEWKRERIEHGLDISLYDLHHMPLPKIVDLFQQLIVVCSEQGYQSLLLNIDYDECHEDVWVSGMRRETEEESQKREKKRQRDRKYRAKIKAEDEREERKVYERLKKRFGY